ncbi:MAG: hypothetical protein MUC68_10560 [Burkholderiaceae bacterium]|jgi:hypothetical protein|nr:hypothetical protein [Burkholderiaceae bacterium]
MKWARIVGGVAVDVVTALPHSLFAPELAAQFESVPDQVQQGMVRLQAIVNEELVPGVQVWMPSLTYLDEFEPGRWAYVTPEAPPAPDFSAQAHARRWITKLAFRNRFTQAERVGLELASLDNPAASMPLRAAAAGLRAALADIQAALYIDLDRPDTRAAVIALEETGRIGPGRALEILDLPMQPQEVYPPRE